MIHIERLLEPEILVKNKTEWTEKFIKSEKKRPSNSQYGHPKIRETLYCMSFQKCFYCEKDLKGDSKEIDHYIEVAERKDLAFEWNNLYLSCKLCNGKKIANKSIANSSTLNPCEHTDEEIIKHITFDDENITTVSDSEIGRKTIQKYDLNSIEQNYNRRKEHRIFAKYYIKTIEKMIVEDRKEFDKNELEFLNSFKSKDKPYSLMFKVLLSKIANLTN